ncbi:MAG: hypothetical protein ABL998_13385 [Planctomycetota bacterium]
MGRRLLRYFLYGLSLLFLAGLWAFSFFFFNPFEGGYDYPIASLIPRDVDFYAAKNELARDFDPFPRPVFLDELEGSPEGQALLALGLRDQVAAWKLDVVLAELERVLEQMPVRIDPLSFFGGQGLAVAGRFTGTDLAASNWAVYGRTSWLGKLVFELIAGGHVDLAAQGITVEPFEHEGERIGARLSGGNLAVPLYLARVLDVVVVANDGALLTAADAFENKRGEDSLLQSAKYADHIARAAEQDALELYFDERALAEKLKLGGSWPNAQSNEPATALAGRLFQLAALRELIGTVAFDKTTTVDLTGELLVNALTPFQQRLYDERGFDKNQMLEAASLAPNDCGLFLYLHADIGDLLRELRAVFQAIDPAAIGNLEDFVRTAWNHDGLEPLIDDFDAALRGRAAFFLRDHDWPAEVDGPPHDDTPVYAWALVLWPQDQKKLDGLLANTQRPDVLDMLKVQGPTPGSRGLFVNTLQGGAKVTEYWNVFLPGTGHLATLAMQGRENYFVVTNENRFAGQIFKLYNSGRSDEGKTRLSEDTAFQTWVGSGLGNANFLAWLAPGAMAATSKRVAEHAALQSGADYIDWNVERPRIEREVITKSFPTERWPDISPGNRDAYEQQVQEEVDRFQASYLAGKLPALQADSQRWLTAQNALRAGFFQLSSDRKSLRMQARLGVQFTMPE